MLECLKASKYERAIKAFEFIQHLEDGQFRSDRVTPNFHHMLSIARLCWTFKDSLESAEDTIIVALLHDVLEDHPVTHGQIMGEWGKKVADAVELLSRNLTAPETYYANLSLNPLASVVKLVDRIHNLKSMINVFSVAKQERYLKDTLDNYLEIVRVARKAHPWQARVYENLKIILLITTDLVEDGLITKKAFNSSKRYKDGEIPV